MPEWKWIVVLLVMGTAAHHVDIYDGHLLVDTGPRDQFINFFNRVFVAMDQLNEREVALSEIYDSQWLVVRHSDSGRFNDLTSYGNSPTTMITIIPLVGSCYILELQYCRSNMDCQSQYIAVEPLSYLYHTVSAIDQRTKYADPKSSLVRVWLIILGVCLGGILYQSYSALYYRPHTREAEDTEEEAEGNYHHHLERQELMDKITRLTTECARGALPDENTLSTLLTEAEQEYTGDQELITALTELETMITEKMDLSPDKECCVCRTWPKTHVFIPCGHIALCLLCTQRHKFKKCLVCNAKTAGIYRTYD